MYGLVNRAVEELIALRHGPEAWAQVRALAGLRDQVFISHQSYDDELTYRLVDAASKVLQLPPDAVLREFGEFWVLKTGRENYGHLIKAAGRTLPEFLQNLPQFHTRIMLMFPKLRPPSFRVEAVAENQLELHYISHRKGLTPFVFGLLSGLGKLFGAEVRATLTASRETGDAHEVFLVQWKPLQPA